MKVCLFKYLAVVGIASSLFLTPQTTEAVLASVKTTGMAATGIAYPQDALAGAFNPAGMAAVGDRFDMGFTWDNATRRSKVSGNRAVIPGTRIPVPGINGSFSASRSPNLYNGDFGINKQLPCNMSVGLVVYNRNANKTTYKNAFPLLGTSRLGMEYIHETISPTFAIKLWKCHNFGVSLNWMIQRLKVNGIQNFDNPLFSSAPGRVTNRGYSYAHGVSYTVGYRGQLTRWLSVGVTYQPKTHMGKFHKYKGFLAEHGKLDIPEKIGGGVAVRFLPCASVAFDVEHIDWKHIRALHNPLLTPPALFINKLGTKHGTGFGFRSQTFYRVGIDYDICDCLTVRAGFRHARTPIRGSQAAVNLLTVDTVQDYLTLGATWCINRCNEVSFFYAHGFEHKVKGRGAIPAFLGGGNVELKEYDNAVGISWGMAY